MLTSYAVSGLADDAEVTTALVTAALALDRVLATTPSWSAAHHAREAIEAFLAEHAPDWPGMAAGQSATTTADVPRIRPRCAPNPGAASPASSRAQTNRRTGDDRR